MAETNMVVKKLLKMKEIANDAKSELDQLQGKRTALTDQLKKEFDCNTLKQAERKLNEIDADLEKQEDQLSEGVKDLENNFNWGGV